MTRVYGNSWKYTLQARTGDGKGSLIYFKDFNLVYPVIFTDFSMNSGERVQTIEAFNDALHIYAFGKRTASVSIRGMLLSDSVKNESHQQLNKLLMRKYDQMRAFTMAKAGKLVEITGPGDLRIKGAIIGLDIGIRAEQDNVIPFTLSMLVTESIQ
jgi:hypothetical protein